MASVHIPAAAVALGSADNLRRLYSMATADDIAKGIAWYTDALEVCTSWASTFTVPILRTVRAMAALSPLCPWRQNIRALGIVCRNYFVHGFLPPPYTGTYKGVREMAAAMPRWGIVPVRANVIKALWELQGHAVLAGPKVSAFADNILSPHTSQAVTVDSHHVMAWLGLILKGTYQFPAAWHERIAADTRTVAAEVGYSPLVFQAIVWETKHRVQAGGQRQALAIFQNL